jgi:hypothetical protein
MAAIGHPHGAQHVGKVYMRIRNKKYILQKQAYNKMASNLRTWPSERFAMSATAWPNPAGTEMECLLVMDGLRAFILAGAVLAAAPALAAPTTVTIEPLGSPPFSVEPENEIPVGYGSSGPVTINWNPLNDLNLGMRFWDEGYSGGRAAAFCAFGQMMACPIEILVAPGSFVTLESFFLGSYEDVDRTITYSIIDLFNSISVADGSPTVGAAGLTVTVGATSSVGFRIMFGPDSYDGGINDLVYSSSTPAAVPAPPALALFGIGLLGLGLAARRRTAA